MAAASKIEWTDATVNFWWGCTKVGPGCDHCYAETLSARFGGNHWGIGAPCRKIKGAVKLLHRLDNDYSEWSADWHAHEGNARTFGLPAPTYGSRRRVFIQSMSDLFDLEVPQEWFQEAWETIHKCNRIDIQIVTKRVSAVDKRLFQTRRYGWPQHAGLIVTVTNQDEADRDIPRLLALMAHYDMPWIGLSIEPMLGPITLPQKFLALGNRAWVICRGESGPAARPIHPAWARALRDQCAAASLPFFFKQWGHWQAQQADHENPASRNWILMYPDGVTDIPDDRFPFYENGEIWIDPVGKRRSGRILDGREYNGMPDFRRAG